MKEIDAAIEALPSLDAVITWLENGCDPKEAAKELRLYAKQIDTALDGLRSLKEQERYGYVVTDTRGMQYFYKDTPYLDTAVECQDVFTHPAPEAKRIADCELALSEWLKKTEWVQEKVSNGQLSARFLGMHRADVLRELALKI